MKIINKIFLPLVYGILYALSLMPMRIQYVFSDLMYLIIYKIAGYRRKTVRGNLESSFPEKSKADIKKTEREFYHWFCDYIVETFKLLSIGRGEMRRRMVFKGTEAIEELINEGKSCGLYLGHYCNWEWISTLPMSITGKCVCAELYHPLENSLFDKIFLKFRQRFGSVCIPMQESMRHIVRYRNEGQPLVIGYIADQKPHWKNIHLWMDFLNHKDTPVLTGAERIVKRMGQAFFYADVRRVRRGYYECEFKLLERDTTGIPDYQITERYMRALERNIRREPAFWLWSHDRWKRTRAEFDRRFYEKDGRVYER